jgi:hypothetical protein
MNLILGLVAIIVGLLIAAYGTRGFFLLLPLFGFVVGFLLGGQVVTELFGDGLFATALGWLVGFVVGLGFAVLAGLWWWAAVAVLFGVVGYELGSGVLIAIGLDPGFVTAVVGVVVGVGLAVLAIALDAPTLLVAAVTAFGGAAYAVAGLFLVLRQVTVDALQEGPIGSLEGHTLGLIVWLALGAVAFGFQSVDTRRRAIEGIDRSRYLVG